MTKIQCPTDLKTTTGEEDGKGTPIGKMPFMTRTSKNLDDSFFCILIEHMRKLNTNTFKSLARNVQTVGTEN